MQFYFVPSVFDNFYFGFDFGVIAEFCVNVIAKTTVSYIWLANSQCHT